VKSHHIHRGGALGDDLSRFFASLRREYRFERAIGSGGMAVVWLAEDLRHGRRVAVKLLRPELLVGKGHHRFLREIGILSELNHPNILPLLDSGEASEFATGVAVPFFTMPYVAGETLRDRLEARGRLPLDEVVAMVADVAAALDHAHAAGIVHRDIKPANLLFSGGRAVVADFGIARAVDAAIGGDGITETGARIGTPRYLAPESEADGRADQYALACVVFEALSGSPPFTGDSVASLMAKHIMEPPPSLRTGWPECPPGLDNAIRRALAKSPDERFPTVREFAAALDAGAKGGGDLREAMATSVVTADALPRPWRVPVAALGVVTALLFGWALVSGRGVTDGAALDALDSTRYVILPGAGTPAGEVEEELLRDALRRWSGITIVDPFQARAVIARELGTGVMSPAIASAIATKLGAGRYVLRESMVRGDSTRLRLALYSTAANRLIGERAATLPLDAPLPPGLLEQLADTLVLSQLGAPPAGTSLGGSASLPALQAFAHGGAALGEWRLSEAERAFAAALRHDPSYAPAALWLALVRSWLDAPPAGWRSPAERALAAADGLSARDRAIATALRARAAGDFAAACDGWRGLGAQYPRDFVAQYGLADCLVHDVGVLPDRASRSGWRFRASWREANEAYGRAFALFPPIYRSLEAGAPGAARIVYQARYAELRFGRAVSPDTGTFTAHATLEGDTVAFVPMRTSAVTAGDPVTIPPAGSVEGAAHALRRQHYEAVTAWLDAAPDQPQPLAAMAEVLERMGDRTALDTLRRARTLAVDPDLAFRLAAAEVWMALRAALPDDMDGLRRARLLADSLLASRTSLRDFPFERAALAALTGRGALATALWRQPELTARLDVPPYLVGDAPALQVMAAMGGPADSVLLLERRVATAIDREFAGADRAGDRLRWLAPAAAYAYPHVVLRSLTTLRGTGDPIVDAAAAMLERDSAAVRDVLAPYTAYRARVGRSDLTLDALPTEARLRWESGDRDGALALLDANLGTLFGRDLLGEKVSPLDAAGLVRAAALRARCAAALGDAAGARRWAMVVQALWSDADPALASIMGEAAAKSGTGSE
jgi:hypothetical protein